MRIGKLLLAIILIAALVVAAVFVINNYTEGDKISSSTIEISEVMSSNKGAVPDGKGGYPDWIELHNATDKAVNIGGYGMSDDLFKGAKYVFPAGTSIPADGYIVVFCSGESSGPLFAPFKLAATDSAVLFDTAGKALCSMDLRAVQGGMSLARDESGSYIESKPSPGFANTDAGIAEYEATLHTTENIGVYINEFMASNATTVLDKDGVYSDWIELYNSTDGEVDLTGFGISDTLSQPVKASIPDGTVIGPKSCLLIFCSGNKSVEGEAELHIPFSLRAYEEDIVLSDKMGRIIDSYSYTRQESDVSMARVPDGSGEFAPSSQPTPGFLNTEAGYQEFIKTAQAHGDLYISELMGANATALASGKEHYDWVELHNQGTSPISLAGYGLSDNPNNPAKWVFPDITMNAGEYLVLYASGLNRADAQKKNDLHLNFSIAASGETVFLFGTDGKLVDKLSAGAFLNDISYGRGEDGSRYYYTASSPGGVNGVGKAGITSTVAFSSVPGIYDSQLSVQLLAADGESIYYTLDCTQPTANSTPYTGPINVDKNTVIRAAAMRDGYITGQSISGTYLLRSDNVNHAVPVVSLVMEPDDLWNSKTGIYAMGDKYDPSLPLYADSLISATYYESKLTGDEAAWERQASFSLFDEGGKQVFNQNVGARIAGSFGRGRAQKGFNIIARDEYGDNRLAYPFFDNREYTEYKALVLRAGGQDQNRSKIRDELAAGLLDGADVNMLVQAYRPCVLYLNGEYWGVYFMKEKRNRFFVAQHEGTLNAEDMNIGYASSRVTYGTNDEWMALTQYINTNDLSVQANYDYVASQVDLNSFMDYMICEIYVGNTDHANIQYYKLPGDKWKWIYYDFCWGFGSLEHNTLAYRRGDMPAASGMFNALLKNSAWRDAFVKRFAQLLKSVYSPERVNAKIDELYGYVEPEIAREREKFNQGTFMGVAQRAENLGSYKSFISQIEALHKYANGRPAQIKSQLKTELGLSDAYINEVFG
ncbi:MAG: lamin tail domain-containing protein [Clostridia bacterium]